MAEAAMAKKRVAVLISGRGSNMAALIEAAKAPDYPAEIALVAVQPSRRRRARHARRPPASPPRSSITPRFGKDREGFERAIDRPNSPRTASTSSASPASCGC